MSRYQLAGVISDTSPATASTAVSANSVTGLDQFDWFAIEADLLGATGGVLDVYLQRRLAADLWRDWLHFTQLAASAAAVKYSVQSSSDMLIRTVGGGSTAAPGVALAAGVFVGGHPGTELRAVYVAGASTSAGAAQLIRIFGWKN